MQKREQRDLGVMADWEAPGGIYRTLGESHYGRDSVTRLISDHDYIMRQLRLFKQMVSRSTFLGVTSSMRADRRQI